MISSCLRIARKRILFKFTFAQFSQSSQIYEKMTSREHILHRPGMYIGLSLHDLEIKSINMN